MAPGSPVPSALYYLYAIVDGLPRRWRFPGAGVGGAPIVARAARDLVLIVSPLDVPPARTTGAVAVHHDVVASLLDARAVLPFQFGTTLPAAELDRWLGAHVGRVRAALAELRDAVEMTVRLLRLDERQPASAKSGQIGSVAEQLIERAGLPTWRYVPAGSTAAASASLAFLVPREDVQNFLVRIAPVASHAAGVAVVPSGPWPPYSFAPALGPLGTARTALAG